MLVAPTPSSPCARGRERFIAVRQQVPPSSTSAVILAVLLAALLPACSLFRSGPAPGSSKGEVVSGHEQLVPEGEALPRDPANLYHTFDNGVSFIGRQHAHPPDQIALYLHIRTGALNETSAQDGVAHFLEHMAFNGTTHFAPGELVPHLSSLGMQFGPDLNAHTTRDETVYKLIMPDEEPETIDEALLILSDYAYGMLLGEEEIDRERDIILNEKRTRFESPQGRIMAQVLNSVYAGTRFGDHDVIGEDDVIRSAPAREFRDYYATWYRPDRMTLIAVGDVDMSDVLRRAEKRFGPDAFQAREPSRQERSSGLSPVDEERAFVVSDPEQGMAMVQVQAFTEGRAPIRTYEQLRFNEVENLGPWIVNRRLREMVSSGRAAFQGASVGVSSIGQDVILPSAFATGVPEKWPAMTRQIIAEVKRLCDHGTTDAELELAKKSLLASAERAVELEATRDAQTIIDGISSAVGSRAPLLSAGQYLERLQRMLPTVTADEVTRVFRDNYARRNYTFTLMLPEREGIELPTSEQVLALVDAAWQGETERAVEVARRDRILETPPQPGSVVSRDYDEDLGITTLRLSNGAVVHHRFMDYKKDQVGIVITIPGGLIEESADSRALSSVASLIGATSDLSSAQIRDLMTGKKVGVSSGFGFDGYTVRVSGSPADFEAGLELAYAMLVDGKIEQSAFDNWKQASLEALDVAPQDLGANFQHALARGFFGGDPRYTPLTREQIERADPAAAEAWLKHVLGRAPLEVSLVGDMNLERALPLVLRYVGSLPAATTGNDVLEPFRTLSGHTGPYIEKAAFESESDKAMVLAGFQGSEDAQLQDRRLLAVASMVLEERMTKRIREDLGLVYGIGCSHRAAVDMPGTGLFVAQAPTDPQKAEQLADEIVTMMRTFAADGPSDDEVATARTQIANILDNVLREPSFWLMRLADLEYRGRTLEQYKGLREFYEQVTRDRVLEVAKRYFVPEREVRILAVPHPKPPVE